MGKTQNTQETNKRNNSNSTEESTTENGLLLKRENLDIFQLVTTPEGVFVALNGCRLTEMQTKEECEKWVSEITWLKIAQVILSITKQNQTTKNYEN